MMLLCAELQSSQAIAQKLWLQKQELRAEHVQSYSLTTPNMHKSY